MTLDITTCTAQPTLVRRRAFPSFDLRDGVTIDEVHSALLAWCIQNPAITNELAAYGPQWLPRADATLRVVSNGSGRCWAIGVAPERSGRRVVEVMLCSCLHDEADDRHTATPRWRVIFSATALDLAGAQQLCERLTGELSAAFSGTA